MQKLVIAALGAAALLSVPAFAATPETGTPATGTTTGTSASGSSQAATSAMPSGSETQPLRLKITQDLEKDGFKDVHVVADSFLVHAINKEGQSVVMIINPDSVFSVTRLSSADNTAPAKPGSTPTKTQ
jgi:hypothetical protein